MPNDILLLIITTLLSNNYNNHKYPSHRLIGIDKRGVFQTLRLISLKLYTHDVIFTNKIIIVKIQIESLVVDILNLNNIKRNCSFYPY